MQEREYSKASIEIIQDLFAKNKMVMLLIALLLITALGKIWVTNTSRLLISEKSDLILKQQSLENESVNLRLEQTILGEKSRIEELATKKLNMHPISQENEVIVFE